MPAENNKYQGKEDRQIDILIEITKVIWKLRKKSVGFWSSIIISIFWLLLILLLKRGSVLEILPYNAPTFQLINETDQKEYFLNEYNGSICMCPMSNYSKFLAEDYFTYLGKREVKYFNEESTLNSYFAKSNKSMIAMIFNQYFHENLKRIFFSIRINGKVNSNRIVKYMFDGTQSFIGHKVEYHSEHSDYSQTGKKNEFNNNNEGNYAVLTSLSILCVLLGPILETIELREFKMFLLLSISGAFEKTIWLSLFVVDICIIIPHSILVSLIIHCCQATKNTDFGLVFTYSTLHTISLYLFLLFFVSLIQKSSNFKYFAILCFMAAIFVTISQNVAFKHSTNKHIIKSLVILFPQFSPYLFYQNVEYSLYLNRTLNWQRIDTGNIIETKQLFLYCSISIIIYTFGFILCLLMNSRPNGVPLIGWKNLFNQDFWKSLFSKPLNYQKRMTSSKDESLIRVENLSKTYFGSSTNRVLNEISFDIFENEVIVLIGASGSGKSTFLSALTGSIEPENGILYLSGEKIISGFSEIQKYVGIAFQDNVFFPSLSVKDHLHLFGRIRGIDENELNEHIERITNSLDFHSSLSTLAGSLSGGQKRKLCMALAFIGDPPIVILDEPTAGVDVTSRQIIWKSMSQFKKTTIIVSTHSLEEAESVSSRIFVLKSGKLAFNGTSSELRRIYNCGYRLNPLGSQWNIDSLFNDVKSIIPDSFLDPERGDSIMIPIDDRVPNILEMIDNNYNNSFNLTVEALEEVLLRLISKN